MALHIAIDYPVRYFGWSHRRFFHTVEEAIEFALIIFPDDPDAVFSGRLHIWLDKECSRNKKFKRLLESDAKRYERWSKNPWKITEFKPHITRDDLLLRFFRSTEREQLKTNGGVSARPKKRKNRKRKVKKKKDEFWDWLKLCK